MSCFSTNSSSENLILTPPADARNSTRYLIRLRLGSGPTQRRRDVFLISPLVQRFELRAIRTFTCISLPEGPILS